MAETKNIDEIAGIVSSRVFYELKWEFNKKTDLNWQCCMRSHLSDSQAKAIEPNKTHPTDVVFSYTDPYTNIVQYIQTDLKSYSKVTIEKKHSKGILEAVESLGQQVECAKLSNEWQKMYLKNKSSNFNVHGMLFIYNHDNEYDSELFERIPNVEKARFPLPDTSLIAIFSPRLIRFLLDVTENIEARRNIDGRATQQKELLWQKIPDYTLCSFFYPDKHNKFVARDKNLPASLEMITSGMLFYSYEHNFLRADTEDGERITKRILNIYWQEDINTEEHFIFLLEYIFNYQLLHQFDRIYIITPFSSASGDYLEEAIKSYAQLYSFTTSQLELVNERVKSLPFVNQKLSIFPFQVASKQVGRVCNY
ncbi:hypothetical protein [Aeromonas veronii]|uniref:hypothetical protein n=1 Tax=Aeromonas veronii TaxID=654 RepID=UPI00244423D8|nr:hypothetical protein [Aeromonas veronii]